MRLAGRSVMTEVMILFMVTYGVLGFVIGKLMEARARTVEAEGMAGVAETVATNGLAPAFREANAQTYQELISLLAANDPAGYAAQCRALVAMRGAADLPRVQAPALLVCGELDKSSPPAMSRENAARLPDSRVVELAGCAHIIPWEKPRELLDAAKPFLAEHLR